MKGVIFIKNILLFSILLLAVFACTGGEIEDGDVPSVSGTECTINTCKLNITNSSGNIVNEVLIHSESDYNSGVLVGSNLSPGDEILNTDLENLNLIFEDQDTFYITFKRYVTAASSIEIAVKTPSPIRFLKCGVYDLYLLEEDFYIEKNYSEE